MEWSWRTLLILMVLVLVGVIVADGFRRMRKNRQAMLHGDIDPHFPRQSVSHSATNPELPSGGFRVVKQPTDGEPIFSANETDFEPSFDPLPDFASDIRSDADHALKTNAFDFATEPPVTATKFASTTLTPADAPRSKPDIPDSPIIPKVQVRPVNLDEAFPVLLDVEELGGENLPDAKAASNAPIAQSEPNPETPPEPSATSSLFTPLTNEPPLHSAALDEALAIDTTLDEEVAELPKPIPLYPVNFANADAEKLSDRPAPELVLVIHCIARPNQAFAGKDLIYLFNSCDLRFGEKDIFHRFEQADGKGPVQFSVVPSYQPQSFSPSTMAKEYFRGLSFFLRLPGVKKPAEAYEAMTGLTTVLAKDFGAELFDGARSAFTQQTIEHDRQQIIDYERRQRLASIKQRP